MAEQIGGGQFGRAALREPDLGQQLWRLAELMQHGDPSISQLGMPGGPRGLGKLPRVPLVRPPMAPNPLPDVPAGPRVFTPQQEQMLGEIDTSLKGMYRGKRFPGQEPIMPEAVSFDPTPLKAQTVAAFNTWADTPGPASPILLQIYREAVAKELLAGRIKSLAQGEQPFIMGRIEDIVEQLLRQRVGKTAARPYDRRPVEDVAQGLLLRLPPP